MGGDSGADHRLHSHRCFRFSRCALASLFGRMERDRRYSTFLDLSALPMYQDCDSRREVDGS